MPSRRRVLAASVPLLTATAGCLGGGAPDVHLSNRLEREVWVRLTIERERDGERVFRRTVEIPTVGDDDERFQNPVADPEVEHTMHVLVKNGPEAPKRFAGTFDEPFSPGIISVSVDIEPEGIQFAKAVS